MSLHSEFRARLAGAGGSEPLFLADLTAWYRRSLRRNEIPAQWQGVSLHDVYRNLGLPIWDVAHLWREQVPGLRVEDETKDSVRTRIIQTASGPLSWRWELGDDAAWRQVRFPIAGPADMPSAVLWARALAYEIDTTGLTELEASIGSDGILAIALPRRPAVQLGASLVGWQQVQELMDEPAVAIILESLDMHLQELVTALAQLSGTVQVSPDGLATATTTPAFFDDYLAASYRTTVDELDEYLKALLVQTRGDISELAQPLHDVGVRGLYNVQAVGPDVSLGALSARLGERLTLWGGIDAWLLSPSVGIAEFEQAVKSAADDASGHRGIVLGISGRWPADADLDRLRLVPGLIQSA